MKAKRVYNCNQNNKGFPSNKILTGRMIQMGLLTDKQIKYGVDYFHQDEPQSKCIIEVSEYKGESTLTINCTQLGDSFTPQYKTAKEKKRVIQEWCDFLKSDSIYRTDILYEDASRII